MSRQISFANLVPLFQLKGTIDYVGDYCLGSDDEFLVLADDVGACARITPAALLAHPILERLTNRARCEAVISLTRGCQP